VKQDLKAFLKYDENSTIFMKVFLITKEQFITLINYYNQTNLAEFPFEKFDKISEFFFI
jgi:hypothetical protein